MNSRREYYDFSGRLLEADYDYVAFRITGARGLRRYIELHPSELEYLARVR